MTRRDWWIGIALVAVAFLAHAAFPRYEWRASTVHPDVALRFDRWRGTVTLVYPRPDLSARDQLLAAYSKAQERAAAARMVAAIADGAAHVPNVGGVELARLQITAAEKAASAAEAEALSAEALATLKAAQVTASR